MARAICAPRASLHGVIPGQASLGSAADDERLKWTLKETLDIIGPVSCASAASVGRRSRREGGPRCLRANGRHGGVRAVSVLTGIAWSGRVTLTVFGCGTPRANLALSCTSAIQSGRRS